MKNFDYPHMYRTHHEHVSRMWLMVLQYLVFSLALACMIVIVWVPEYWIQAAVTSVLLFIAGAACKSGRS